MINKIKSILSSVRFWQVVLIALFQGLLDLSIIDNATFEAIARLLQSVLGASVLIGSADSVALKLSNKK